MRSLSPHCYYRMKYSTMMRLEDSYAIDTIVNALSFMCHYFPEFLILIAKYLSGDC